MGAMTCDIYKAFFHSGSSAVEETYGQVAALGGEELT